VRKGRGARSKRGGKTGILIPKTVEKKERGRRIPKIETGGGKRRSGPSVIVRRRKRGGRGWQVPALAGKGGKAPLPKEEKGGQEVILFS